MALTDGITGKGFLFLSEELDWYRSLSLEECIRFAVSIVVFKRRGWMNQLKA